MNGENQLYQLSCHFSPLLDQNQLEGIVQDLKKMIAANESFVLTEGELSAGNIQRKKLAYPIQKYQEAFYLSFDFLANSQNINQFNNQLNLNKDILRHLIVAKQKPSSSPKEIIDYKATEQIEFLSRKKKMAVGDGLELSAPAQEVAKKKAVKKITAKKRQPKQIAANEKDREEKAKIEELDKKLEEILKY